MEVPVFRVFVAAALAMTLFEVSSAQACGRRWRCDYVVGPYYHAAPAYVQPAPYYYTPQYVQPAPYYSTPTYEQPAVIADYTPAYVQPSVYVDYGATYYTYRTGYYAPRYFRWGGFHRFGRFRWR
jgi:hypothetical protein